MKKETMSHCVQKGSYNKMPLQCVVDIHRAFYWNMLCSIYVQDAREVFDTGENLK